MEESVLPCSENAQRSVKLKSIANSLGKHGKIDLFRHQTNWNPTLNFRNILLIIEMLFCYFDSTYKLAHFQSSVIRTFPKLALVTEMFRETRNELDFLGKDITSHDVSWDTTTRG